MRRRTFIKGSAVVSLPIMLNGMRFGTPALANGLSSISAPQSDRVLVIIQLEGGNDGLNTVIPVEVDKYYKLRPTIGISKNSALTLDKETLLRLHPSMKGMQEIFNEGELAFVCNVGYANSTQSHFEGTEIWNTGSSRELKNKLSTGWMGRFLQSEYPSYPEITPNDPPAIQINPATSSVFTGNSASIAMSLTNPTEFYNIVNSGSNKQDNIEPNTPAGKEFNFINLIGGQSVQYANSIKNAASKAANKAIYPQNNLLAEELAIIARLVAGGLQTRVYMVSLAGFDTHAAQLQRHTELLTTLSEAIKAFTQDLKLLGVSKRVIGMTYSEFGRRVNENGSGTDHGMASTHFVFGNEVQGGKIYGGYPDFNNMISYTDASGVQQSEMKFNIDYRCYYSAILKGVFGVTDNALQSIFPVSGNCGNIPNIITPPTSGVSSVKEKIGKMKLE